MQPKQIKQSLQYNPLLLPKDHKDVIQHANFELWNELNAINSSFSHVQIHIDHVVKDFGHYYGIDLEINCENKEAQRLIDVAYERNMRLPRFEKHKHFDAMIITDICNHNLQ